MQFKFSVALFPLIMFGTPIYAQIIDQNACVQCLTTAKAELKTCLDGAISQEDKKSCVERQETRTKTCDNGECKIERAAQSGILSEALSATNRTPSK
jgi:hypothetical protein